MGLFDWLFSKPDRPPEFDNVDLEPDNIWLSHQARLAGLTRHVSELFERESPPSAVLLVAHFPARLVDLEQAVADAGVDGPVAAATVDQLESLATGRLALNASHRVEVVVGERHPLATADDDLLEFLGKLPCYSRVQHHLSLDDAVLRIATGPWLENMLRTMGMTEDEAIETATMSDRIRRLQRRLEPKVSGDQAADSAEQWLQRNCPEQYEKLSW